MRDNFPTMRERKPDWLKVKLETTGAYSKIKDIVASNHLHTICSSGKCPNIGTCWSMGTATFMILGDICTRSCKFCATQTGKPLAPDAGEQQKVAESIRLMQLKHCVITSVDRDDLPDKGAGFWADTIRAVREKNPHTLIEVLVPDFDNVDEHLQPVFDAKPDIFGHNMETVERLSPLVRSRAKYRRSLDVLRKAHEQGLITKSGIMLGLGETEEEVVGTLNDLQGVNCQMLTIGQMCSATLELIDMSIDADPLEHSGRILLARAGVDAVWSEALKLVEELGFCAEVQS